MSSVAEPFQRDELHVFLAVLLHLAAGLIIYAFVATGERNPPSVMLEGLPIMFGKMISQGERDGDAPKTLTKSNPVQAKGTAPEAPTQVAEARLQEQQKPVTAEQAKPAVQQSGTVTAAKAPITPEARSTQPKVNQTQARQPAAVALNSATGTPATAANVPSLRLQPDPDEAERNRPPVEATAVRTVEAASQEPQKSVPPTASKATEEATAKLANVPGVKPAIVPQLDSRQRVVVPPKPVERTPEQAEDPEVKLAEAKRAAEAKAAALAAAETKTPVPPAVNKPTKVDVATSEPPKTVEPPAVAAATPQVPETQASVAVPETKATQQDQTTQSVQTTVPDTGGQTTGAAPVPRARAQEPQQQQTASVAGGQQQGGTPHQPTKPAGGGGTGAKTSGGASGQTAADALRKASAALSGRLGGLGKGKNGVPGGTSLTGSQLTQGSRLAQACLERKQVFKFGDKISTTFDVRIDRGLRRLFLSSGSAQRRSTRLSAPRLAEINAALNSCDSFKKFVLEQPGLTTFSFNFQSGLR